MNKLKYKNKETTYLHFGLDITLIVMNLSEGLCFRYSIPKHEKQLITYFNGLTCHSNFAAVINWVYDRVMVSEAQTEIELIEEIDGKFDALLGSFMC